MDTERLVGLVGGLMYLYCLMLAILMAIVEVLGVIGVTCKRKRNLLIYFALGFAASMALFDMLPDAASTSLIAYPLFLLGLLFVIVAWYFESKVRIAAVFGMGFHDFFEGVLASFALTPLTAVALVLHKMPEGMAVLALLDEFNEPVKPVKSVFKVIPIALLIPAGAVVGRFFSGFSVLIGFCAGIVFGTTVKLMVKNSSRLALTATTATATSASAVAGAAIAALTALIV